ncbi:polysaccharide deacetylase family protein [Halopseudomonas bauzanensis]|uniref:polysaccharide deacetylase family protein n=1 Tax=Halopseudomonas bauzanensis TaxID=653930 RepID=UPI003524D154
MKLSGAEGGIRFDTLQLEFHQSQSNFPCGEWNPYEEGLVPAMDGPLPTPGLINLANPLIQQRGTDALVHYDILGLTYWMLNRLEETSRTDLDSHQRFQAKSSHAYQHGYLERPIVDEWLFILGQLIKRVWPTAQLKIHEFHMKVSHDIDAPSRYGFRSAKSLLRGMAGDVLKNKSLKSAMLGPWIRLNTKQRLHPADPFNTFEWLMDISEECGVKSAFYLICGRTDPTRDADYEPEHPAIRNLMRRIHERGHEIGLHASYGSYKRPEVILAEANRLRLIAKEEGIMQDKWGGRMHYLRWEHPTTLRAWEQAGMSYDSTLGYADLPGFRCGTCFEYPAFDPIKQQLLNIRIRPLIAMECTVIAERYMNLGYTNAALSKFVSLKEACRVVGGCFTLLWHNSHLASQQDRTLYKKLI